MSDTFNTTDLGNAERLAAWHGQDMRHVPAWGWLVWTGKVWARSDKLAAARAKATARQILRAASECDDEARRRALASHAMQSEGRQRIAAMLALAESEDGIAADAGEFDKDPMLLNCRNGIVDLRTGQLREHRREDLITKIIDLDFHPDATSELWDRFLVEATKDKPGLADFLRRAAGYTLTGSTRDDAIFIAHGPAGTGKTTFVETLKAALGPYAGSIRIEVLTMSGHASGGHNEDVARLVGLRMVTAVEASESERLREGQVKHMTGGDTVPASLKHKPAFEYLPVFKLWLATNEVPYIRSDDSGMWRRVRKIPFDVEHSRPDESVKDQLKSRSLHLTAVLAWAVRGCLEWQREGLRPPECITEATSNLRRYMDGGFEEFLGSDCQLGDPSRWTATRDIRAAYTKWAISRGIPETRRISDTRLIAILRRRGCEPDSRRPLGPDTDLMRGWWGVEVRPSYSSNSSNASPEFSSRARNEKKLERSVSSVTGVTDELPLNTEGATSNGVIPSQSGLSPAAQKMLGRLKSERGVIPASPEEEVTLEELEAGGLARASNVLTVHGTEWVLR